VEQSNPSIIYSPRCDTTPETELNALANVYRYILDRAYEKGGPTTAHDDAKKESEHVRARAIIPE
jgi:hypothetical protein